MAKVPKAVKEKISSRWLNRVLFSFVIISVASASILFWVIGKRTEESLAEQMLHRQQIVARAGSGSIKNFLDLTSHFLTALAKDPSVSMFNQDSQEALSNSVSDWKGTPVVGVILTDETGIVRFGKNNRGVETETGITVSDREYFKWAEKAKEGQIYIGEPVISRIGFSKGKTILTLSTPVIKNSEFKGVLTSAMILSDLTEKFLYPLRISEDTKILLLTKEGKVVYSPYKELMGINIYQFIDNNSFPNSAELKKTIRKELSKPKEGKFDIVRPNIFEGTTGFTRELIAKSPIEVEGKSWFLVMATPAKDAFVFFPQFHGHQTAALVFMVFVIVGIVALGILAARVAQREAYMEGFSAGRDWTKKKSKK